jgi:hypothetical protein
MEVVRTTRRRNMDAILFTGAFLSIQRVDRHMKTAP